MKTMKVKLEVVHYIPGRARIKIISGFDPFVFFVVVEAGLREIEEIKKAELNPYACSVTVYFRKDVDVSLILEELKRILLNVTNDPAFPQQLEEIKEALTYADGGSMNVFVHDKILTVTRNLDDAVRRVTGNTMDMKTAVSASSFSAGLATLLFAPALPTPTWLVLVIFGFTSFNVFKDRPVHRVAPGDRLAPEGLDNKPAG